MNISEITAKYDYLLEEQKETLKVMNKLIVLGETLLHDLKLINGGSQNAIKNQNV